MTFQWVGVDAVHDGQPATSLIDYDEFCGTVSDDAAAAVADSTISVRTLGEGLEQRTRGERDFTLVDVREPNEAAINRIPGAVLIPKGEFLSGRAFDQLEVSRPLEIGRAHV